MADPFLKPPFEFTPIGSETFMDRKGLIETIEFLWDLQGKSPAGSAVHSETERHIVALMEILTRKHCSIAFLPGRPLNAPESAFPSDGCRGSREAGNGGRGALGSQEGDGG